MMKSDEKPLTSPCVRNCCLNHNDVCVGCYRTLDEIIAWSGADNPTRRQILANCEKRRTTADAQMINFSRPGHDV
jgi:predicted Fe-S protein YdhL (DUF1289 family)